MEMRNPADLKPHPVSLNLYGVDTTEDLVESVREFGILTPIIITPADVVISGHRRWRVALEAGLDSVPVEVRDFGDETGEKRAILEYNRQRDKTFSQKMGEVDLVVKIVEGERKLNSLANSPSYRGGNISSSIKGSTDEIMGQQLKVSSKTFYKAERIWNKAKDGDERARLLIKQLDAGDESISGAYTKLFPVGISPANYVDIVVPVGAVSDEGNNDDGRDIEGDDEDDKVTASMAIVAPKPHVSFNSGENEWYTPQQIVDLARSVLKKIDLDPASTQLANTVVRASKFFSIKDNGLSQDWFGRVWMNPPYAQPLITKFCEKLLRGLETSRVSESIVLVNNATETKWFQDLCHSAKYICFPAGRVRFWSPDNSSSAPLQGQALLYFGDNGESFASVFAETGIVMRVL